MQFRKNGETLLEFIALDPFLAELIKQIPSAADPRGETPATSRLYSCPIDPALSMDPGTESLKKDWEDFVVPELKVQFGSAVAQVQHDIQEYLCEGDGDDDDFPYRLQIPMEHVDAWLSALNQARLVLAARFAFTEEELSRPFQSKLTSLRDLALYQISIYAFLQELIISGLK
ncbi:MAG TPA: hypothetical protein VIT21_04225 [Chthoniobacterales bacterium]